MSTEEPIKREKVIEIEGGDQLGKGDAAEKLAEELRERGEKVLIMSLPSYPTILGSTIREVLVDPEGSFPEDISDRRRLEIIMALFALNRLEVTDYVKEYLDNGYFIIFDRGPYSNALTIAYNEKEGKDYEDIVGKSLELDSLFIETFNTKNCVIQLCEEGSSWKSKRGLEGDDKYENKDTQEKSAEIYQIFSKFVGDGWKKVVSKTENGFRDRDEIKKDILRAIKDRLKDNHPEPQRKTGGSISYFNIKDFYKQIYDIDIATEEIKTLEEALKKNEKKEIYTKSLELVQNVLEKGESLSKINFSDAVKTKMYKILQEYPEILSLLESKRGEKYTLNLCRSVGFER